MLMWNILSITSYAKCYHYFSLLVWSYTLYLLKVLKKKKSLFFPNIRREFICGHTDYETDLLIT